MGDNYLLQFIANGLIMGSIYALTGLGFSLVYNTTRIFHIAYAALFTAGGYACYVCSAKGIPFTLSISIAVVVTSFAGFLIERAVYRPLFKKNASLVVYIISSIGVMALLINLIALVWGNEVKMLTSGISSVINIHGLTFSIMQIYQLIYSIVCIIAVMSLIRYTKAGIFLRSMRDDTDLAMTFGLDIFRMRSYIFIISSALVGLAGGLVGYDVGITPFGGMDILLISLVALIIGGIGHFEGVILGGFLLGIIQSLIAYQLSIKWSGATVFIILVVFLILKPQGLFGRKAREI